MLLGTVHGTCTFPLIVSSSQLNKDKRDVWSYDSGVMSKGLSMSYTKFVKDHPSNAWGEAQMKPVLLPTELSFGQKMGDYLHHTMQPDKHRSMFTKQVIPMMTVKSHYRTHGKKTGYFFTSIITTSPWIQSHPAMEFTGQHTHKPYQKMSQRVLYMGQVTSKGSPKITGF